MVTRNGFDVVVPMTLRVAAQCANEAEATEITTRLAAALAAALACLDAGDVARVVGSTLNLELPDAFEMSLNEVPDRPPMIIGTYDPSTGEDLAEVGKFLESPFDSLRRYELFAARDGDTLVETGMFVSHSAAELWAIGRVCHEFGLDPDGFDELDEVAAETDGLRLDEVEPERFPVLDEVEALLAELGSVHAASTVPMRRRIRLQADIRSLRERLLAARTLAPGPRPSRRETRLSIPSCPT